MRLLVVGAGGHAKVVVDAAELAGHEIAGVVGLPSGVPEVLGHAVVGSADEVVADGYIVAVGDNVERSRLFAEYLASDLAPASIIHPSAILGSDVEIGAGTLIAAGVVINPGARIGDDCILNTGCAVDHDCTIGAHSHVAPRVALCGGVALGDGVLMGVGSCAAQGTSVGDWSVVGAGAAVVSPLPSHSVCVGVPARAIRSAEEPSGA